MASNVILDPKAIRIYLSVRTLSVLVKCEHYNAEYRYPRPVFLSIGTNLHQHYCEIVNSRVVATHAGQQTAPLGPHDYFSTIIPLYNTPPIIIFNYLKYNSFFRYYHSVSEHTNEIKRMRLYKQWMQIDGAGKNYKINFIVNIISIFIFYRINSSKFQLNRRFI